jgi:ribosomal protein S18 acetylase RimI-like enzyme
MIFREASLPDIPQIQIVRQSVKENILSDPGLVTDEDCKEYLTNRGRGWVCEANGEIVGFAIGDLKGKNIWALFVKPDFERRGIGRKLHDMMMDWYFSQSNEKVWLGTAPGTRAASFYKKAGWKETGLHGKGEVKFEIEKEEWITRNSNSGVI